MKGLSRCSTGFDAMLHLPCPSTPPATMAGDSLELTKACGVRISRSAAGRFFKGSSIGDYQGSFKP